MMMFIIIIIIIIIITTTTTTTIITIIITSSSSSSCSSSSSNKTNDNYNNDNNNNSIICLYNATCLIRPRSFYAYFVVSRTIIICCIIRHFWRKPVLDKLDKCWASTNADFMIEILIGTCWQDLKAGRVILRVSIAQCWQDLSFWGKHRQM